MRLLIVAACIIVILMPGHVVGHGAHKAANEPSVTVHDQIVANQQVRVELVRTTGSGWMVIHEMGPNGEAGAVLGATAVRLGETQDVLVSLGASVKPGTTLGAMLHEDTGLHNTLEYPAADAPVFVNGAIVVPTFKVLDQQLAASSLPNAGAQEATPWILVLCALLLMLLGTMFRWTVKGVPFNPEPITEDLLDNIR